jgi:hypothetical protein
MPLPQQIPPLPPMPPRKIQRPTQTLAARIMDKRKSYFMPQMRNNPNNYRLYELQLNMPQMPRGIQSRLQKPLAPLF